MMKETRILPHLVTWGIWLSQNSCIFKDKWLPSFQVTPQVLGMLSVYKGCSKSKKAQMIDSMVTNKHIALEYFDEACQGPDRSRGLGLILYFSDSHFIARKASP